LWEKNLIRTIPLQKQQKFNRATTVSWTPIIRFHI
jgi:hypothetical protein